MTKARLVLPLVLLLVAPMAAQVEHAPTPEQCRADADTWGIPKSSVSVPNEPEFRNLTRAMTHDPAVTARKLDARIEELSMCMRTDSVQSLRFEEGSRALTIAEMYRMAEFVSRHHLETQFYQEDEQGKR
jgi:hypothetical protein